MNSKQSISVLLMLGLIAPLTACGETKESEGTSSPAVIQTPATGTTSAPKEEGGEGGESGESEAEKANEKKTGKENKEGGEGGEGT